MPKARSRLLLYAPNGWGLGHLSRQVALARALRQVDPYAEILFATESAYGPQMAPEFPFFILPSTRAMKSSAWRGTASGRHALSVVQVTDALVAAYRPGAVVHDTLVWPPLFEAAAGLGIKQAMVVRARRGTAAYLANPASPTWRCDLLIFPYEPHEVAGLLPELPPGCPPIACVGPVARRASTSRHLTRQRIGLRDDRKLVLITAGAGGFQDAEPFYRLAVEALAAASERLPRFFTMLVLGPGYTGPLPISDRLNVYVWRDLTWLPDVIAAADVVICQAGHNTMAELQSSNARAVVVPGDRQIDDQFARARGAAALHRNFRLFENGTAAQMAELIVELVAMEPPVETNGDGPPLPATSAGGRHEYELRQVLALATVTDSRPAELPDLLAVSEHL